MKFRFLQYRFEKMKRIFLVISMVLIAVAVAVSCKEKEVEMPQQEEQEVVAAKVVNPFEFCGAEHNRLLDVLRQKDGGAKGGLNLEEVYGTLSNEVKNVVIPKDRFIRLMTDYRGFVYSPELMDRLASDGVLSNIQVRLIDDMAHMLLSDRVSNEAKLMMLGRMEQDLLCGNQNIADVEREALLCFTSVAQGSMDYWPASGVFAEKGPMKAIAVAICDAIGAAVGAAHFGPVGAVALGAAASYEASREF